MLNGALDQSEPTARVEVLIDKQQWENNKGKLRSRAIVVPPWRSETSPRFPVKHSDYPDLVVGQSRLVVLTHPGAFGFEWYEHVEVAAPASH